MLGEYHVKSGSCERDTIDNDNSEYRKGSFVDYTNDKISTERTKYTTKRSTGKRS